MKDLFIYWFKKWFVKITAFTLGFCLGYLKIKWFYIKNILILNSQGLLNKDSILFNKNESFRRKDDYDYTKNDVEISIHTFNENPKFIETKASEKFYKIELKSFITDVIIYMIIDILLTIFLSISLYVMSTDEFIHNRHKWIPIHSFAVWFWLIIPIFVKIIQGCAYSKIVLKEQNPFIVFNRNNTFYKNHKEFYLNPDLNKIEYYKYDRLNFPIGVDFSTLLKSNKIEKWEIQPLSELRKLPDPNYRQDELI